MALSQRLVDAVFSRMLVRYGAAWIGKWEGIPLDDVKKDWANELAGFDAVAIRHALEHLPEERPPTVAQFKANCYGRNKPSIPLLPPPKVERKRVEGLILRMHAAQKERRPIQWAHDLCAREGNGETLTPVQMVAWRKALAEAPTDTLMEFKGIPADSLPPAMRGDE